MTEKIVNVSWIEETAKAVRLAQDLDEKQKQADLLAESKDVLGRVLTQLKELQASSAVVRNLDWEGRRPSPELSRDLQEALQTLDARPLNRVQRALEQFGRDIDASLKKHWAEYAAQQLGDVSDLLALSATLSEIEGIAAVSQELNVALGQLARAQDTLPSPQSTDLLAIAVRLLQQLESSLKPDVVRRFLSAVARGGAAVESLTPEVTEWLAAHQSLGKFKILAGPPVRDSDD